MLQEIEQMELLVLEVFGIIVLSVLPYGFFVNKGNEKTQLKVSCFRVKFLSACSTDMFCTACLCLYGTNCNKEIHLLRIVVE